MKALTIGIVATLATIPVMAKPSPDKVRVCYKYKGDEVVYRNSCVVSSGYGTGEHYMTLYWANGNIDKIRYYLINNSAFVNSIPAMRYKQSSLWHGQKYDWNYESKNSDDVLLWCFKTTKVSDNSICVL
jgi:signal peptidase I